MNYESLRHVGWDLPFRVEKDVNGKGVSGYVYEIDEEGCHRLVPRVSRCLTNAEVHYTTAEKELLAILYAGTKFRAYIVGKRFAIVTDHQGLTFFRLTEFHSGRLVRWSLLLQQYSFNIVYCKCAENAVADFFSQTPESRFVEEEPRTLLLASLNHLVKSQVNHQSNK